MNVENKILGQGTDTKDARPTQPRPAEVLRLAPRKALPAPSRPAKINKTRVAQQGKANCRFQD